jgi:hypothetical protein
MPETKNIMEVKFTTYFPILRTLLVKYVIDTISNRPELQKGDEGFDSGHDFSGNEASGDRPHVSGRPTCAVSVGRTSAICQEEVK